MLVGVVIHPNLKLVGGWATHSNQVSGWKKTPETAQKKLRLLQSLLATNLSQLVWPGNRPFQLTELAEKTPLASSSAVKHLGNARCRCKCNRPANLEGKKWWAKYATHDQRLHPMSNEGGRAFIDTNDTNVLNCTNQEVKKERMDGSMTRKWTDYSLINESITLRWIDRLWNNGFEGDPVHWLLQGCRSILYTWKCLGPRQNPIGRSLPVLQLK